MEVEALSPKKGSGKVSMKATAIECGPLELLFGFEIPYEYEFNFYRDHVDVFTYYVMHCTVSPSFTINISGEANAEQGKDFVLNPKNPKTDLPQKQKSPEPKDDDPLFKKEIPTGFPGLDLVISLDVSVEVSGKIEMGWSKDFTMGYAFLDGASYGCKAAGMEKA